MNATGAKHRINPAQQLRHIAYQLTQLPEDGTACEHQLVRELDKLALHFEWQNENLQADLVDVAVEDGLADRLRYQELFDFAPDGYVITDVRGLIIEGNHAAASFFQTPREFLAGKPLAFFIDPSRRQEMYERLAELNSHRAVQPWETQLQSAKGECRDVLHHCAALFG